MTAPRRAPYHLRIGDSWKHLEGVAPGVPVTPNRPKSLMATLGNTVFARIGPVVKRVWGFSFEWEDAEATRWLDYAAANPTAEVWLLDVNLAQINMLDPRKTKGKSSTTILVDGIPMPAFMPGESFTSTLRPGVAYHLSYTTAAAAGQVIGTATMGGAPVPFVAPEGSGPRRSSLAVEGDSSGSLVVAWAAGQASTAARLTEGSVDDLGFLESRGATPCRVLVDDGAAAYKMAWQHRLALADSSYVLTEVG